MTVRIETALRFSSPRAGRSGGFPAASFILDGRGIVLGFDEAMEALTGWPAVRVVGHDKERIGAGVPGGRLFEGSVAVPPPAAPTATELIRLRTADGCALDVEAVARRLSGPGERAQVTVLRVLARSPAPQADGDLRHDPLTGVLRDRPFRRSVEAAVAGSRESGRPVGVIVADVDHLRRVNDERGRSDGDRVLRKIADLIRVVVGERVDIGRIGDDDFAVLLPSAGRGESRQVAAALRSHVERFRFEDDHEPPLRVTLSIGAASCPADAGSGRDLLARAGEALDEARRLGRNRVWCYLRRPRVPVQVPVYFDGSEGLLVGYTRDLSPSGVFVQTSVPVDIGMRCAFSFPLPGQDGKVHVIGRVVRAVPPDVSPTTSAEVRIPGMGVEFERFGGPEDQRAIDAFLHASDLATPRGERARPSV